MLFPSFFELAVAKTVVAQGFCGVFFGRGVRVFSSTVLFDMEQNLLS